MERYFFPVTLSDGQVHYLAGYLYKTGSWHPDSPLQVAVHGGTHHHLYWDLPTFHGVSYSYARYMAERGYAVLAIDQLGTGLSSQPDGDWVTLDETARALHLLLASLRSADNPIGQAFKQIALVGHSNGSLTSIYSTGTYHDCDALVTTAWEHPPHPLPFDPEEVLEQASTPYLPARTFSKDFHAAAFYHLPSTDPDVFDFDYNHGVAIQARAQFLDLFRVGLDTAGSRSRQVTVPVLVQLGDFDALQPSSYLAPEPDYYPEASSVTLQYLENMGHNINGHINHLQSWQGIDQWLRQTLTPWPTVAVHDDGKP